MIIHFLQVSYSLVRQTSREKADHFQNELFTIVNKIQTAKFK